MVKYYRNISPFYLDYDDGVYTVCIKKKGNPHVWYDITTRQKFVSNNFW